MNAISKTNQPTGLRMDSLPCPSFNVYASSGNNASMSIAHIADRVTGEDRDQHSLQADAYDFEFVALRKRSDCVYLEGGDVGPVYPIFNRHMLIEFQSNETKECNEDSAVPEDEEEIMSLQIPSSNLIINVEDSRYRDLDPDSSSSEEAADLDSVTSGSHSFWSSNSAKATPRSCKESKSTRHSPSKLWKLLDLLRGSYGDSKDNFVFLSPSMDKKVEKSKNWKEQWSWSSAPTEFSSGDKFTGKSKLKASPTVKCRSDSKMSAHEVFYVTNRALKGAEKRRSYLPYRQDLFGFCAILGGSLGGKTFPTI